MEQKNSEQKNYGARINEYGEIIREENISDFAQFIETDIPHFEPTKPGKSIEEDLLESYFNMEEENELSNFKRR